MKRLGVFSIFKNEFPYILEWVAWNRIIGVEGIIIADNESTDGTTELLSALSRAGVLNTFLFPSGNLRNPQMAALEKMLREHGRDFEWVALIDADEFIVPAHGDIDLKKQLQAVAPDVSSIILNWVCFGSNGLRNFENRLVVERFSSRISETSGLGHNQGYKSIVRPSAINPVSNNPHHFFGLDGYRFARFNGRTPELTKESGGGTKDFDWSGWRINHYATKSWSEFFFKKMPRGRVDSIRKMRAIPYFFIHDCNDELEKFPESFLFLLRKEIQHLEGVLADSDRFLFEKIRKFTLPSAPPPEIFSRARHKKINAKASKYNLFYGMDFMTVIRLSAWKLSDFLRIR
jgi:glycosyltransferase involved in cell wall biosynthesis